MEHKITDLINCWNSRNIQGVYCQQREEAIGQILQIIPKLSSVGISGSMTLDELGIVTKLLERGNKVFNQYEPGLSRKQALQIRKTGSQADYYLTSANAISEKGELVFLSAYGERISGIAAAKNVLVICGVNKIVTTFNDALKRSREHAAVLNCKRLKWVTPCAKDGLCHNEICLFSDYQRMCCQLLVIEAEVYPGRLKVILIGEKLGF